MIRLVTPALIAVSCLWIGIVFDAVAANEEAVCHLTCQSDAGTHVWGNQTIWNQLSSVKSQARDQTMADFSADDWLLSDDRLSLNLSGQVSVVLWGASLSTSLAHVFRDEDKRLKYVCLPKTLTAAYGGLSLFGLHATATPQALFVCAPALTWLNEDVRWYAAADKGEVSKQSVKVSQVRMTSCPPSNPLWSVKANQLNLKQLNQSSDAIQWSLSGGRLMVHDHVLTWLPMVNLNDRSVASLKVLPKLRSFGQDGLGFQSSFFPLPDLRIAPYLTFKQGVGVQVSKSSVSSRHKAINSGSIGLRRNHRSWGWWSFGSYAASLGQLTWDWPRVSDGQQFASLVGFLHRQQALQTWWPGKPISQSLQFQRTLPVGSAELYTKRYQTFDSVSDRFYDWNQQLGLIFLAPQSSAWVMQGQVAKVRPSVINTVRGVSHWRSLFYVAAKGQSFNQRMIWQSGSWYQDDHGRGVLSPHVALKWCFPRVNGVELSWSYEGIKHRGEVDTPVLWPQQAWPSAWPAEPLSGFGASVLARNNLMMHVHGFLPNQMGTFAFNHLWSMLRSQQYFTATGRENPLVSNPFTTSIMAVKTQNLEAKGVFLWKQFSWHDFYVSWGSDQGFQGEIKQSTVPFWSGHQLDAKPMRTYEVSWPLSAGLRVAYTRSEQARGLQHFLVERQTQHVCMQSRLKFGVQTWKLPRTTVWPLLSYTLNLKGLAKF